MKRYFDIDNNDIVWRTKAYFQFRGKDIQIQRNGERSILKIKSDFKSAIAFIFNQYEKKKDNKDQGQKRNNSTPVHPQDQDEYIPQNMEDTEDPNKPPSFWQILPPLAWYYYSGKKSYYDVAMKIWSKRKILWPHDPIFDNSKPKHTFSGKVGKGIFSLPLPVGALIKVDSVLPVTSRLKIQQDQKGCFYAISWSIQEISFDFYTDQDKKDKAPITADSEKIITGSLTKETQDLLANLRNSSKNSKEKADIVCNYVSLQKKYSVDYQFYIYHKSTSQEYFTNLDASPLLECYSANTLYVGLMRDLGISSRLCTGHMLDIQNEYGWKSHISNQTGHAWSEIWDGSSWVLMDATPKQKDKNIIDDLKEEIERVAEEKKTSMTDMGFELWRDEWHYKMYRELEDEVRPMIKKNIQALENILPREYHLEEQGYFRSWKLDRRKLVQWKITGDTKIFTRNQQIDLDPELLLFEGIAIDNSGSMGDINTPWSPLREAVKSAIIRARTLEHFDVHFSILIFNTTVHEVMKFWEKYTSRKNTIPSRLMQAATDRWGTDMWKPLELMESRILEFEAQGGKWRYGNITFIGDGEPTNGKTGKDLKKLIHRIWQKSPITAYYISWWGQSSGALGEYFWEENVEVISDVWDLSSAMMRTFNTKLRRKLHQITSQKS